MIHTILPSEYEQSDDILESMYRLRHDVVVEQWNWAIPGATPGHEKDEFDTDETVYFIATGQTGTSDERTALACARLNPTTRPHMMDQLFAEYCDLQDYPKNETVWECSRYLSNQDLFSDRAAAKLARSEVNLAMMDFAIANGINSFIWLTHQVMYGVMLTVWESEPLGRPRRALGEEDSWIAGISKIEHASRARVKDVVNSLRSREKNSGSSMSLTAIAW